MKRYDALALVAELEAAEATLNQAKREMDRAERRYDLAFDAYNLFLDIATEDGEPAPSFAKVYRAERALKIACEVVDVATRERDRLSAEVEADGLTRWPYRLFEAAGQMAFSTALGLPTSAEIWATESKSLGYGEARS